MLKYTRLCINHLKTRPTTLLSNQTDLVTQQTRNTFILKRQYPVPLIKKNRLRPVLRHRNYIYDLVEYADHRKYPDVDLILLKTVEGLGVRGQQIAVKYESAYTKYLLPKVATYATPENIEKYKDILNKIDINTGSSQFAQRAVNLLSQFYLCIPMSMHTPWTIEKWHVRVAFRHGCIIVPEYAITLPEKTISGPDLSIENKEFYVTVKINNLEEVKVRCKIRHWNPKPQISLDAVKPVPIWELPNIAIFPEDQPILDSLPKHRLLTKQTKAPM
ncbi:39S ribosomal protein L9, mitochondrial [Hylaeus anthracinus]|uniref:39S ribosomal protein L9, mitochondrial n=1 Tax=Hylaeus anthracinus TaxID=313031 RepID=UPI0023B8C529|nr:39S ribosomal protein L9, mitochondrial [Hylaeus anthracinus]